MASVDTLLDISIDRIDDDLPLRHRRRDPGMETLMRSIDRYGLLSPILVSPREGGRYRLICGRRRLEACRRLGHAQIAAVVRRVPEDLALQIALQDDLHQAPLMALEEADAIRRIGGHHIPAAEAAEQFVMSEEEVAIGRRLNRLPASIQEAVWTGQIDERRALAISRLSREVDQIRAFRRIREEDPPLAMVEEMIDQMKAG
jgi:ParB family chromosome partitioning protein